MSRAASIAYKYEDEILDQSVDFTAAISTGTISSATHEASPGVSLTISSVAVVGAAVNYRVTGGVSGERHNVDLIATMSTGEKLVHRVVYTVI